MVGQTGKRSGTTEDREAVVSCWSCNGPVSGRAVFCHTCGVIQPPRAVDHFSRLGLPCSFDLDSGDLERRYLKFQRDIHPDRFAQKSSKERAISLQHATDLNDAYHTLKDPLKRGEYLLGLHGADVPGADGSTVSDPELLMEVMELRELLSEVSDLNGLDGLVKKVEKEQKECLTALRAAFSAEKLDDAAGQALRLKYLHKFLDEARGHRSRLTTGL